MGDQPNDQERIRRTPPAESPMARVGWISREQDEEINGPLFWAREGAFMYPGLYIWNGRENVLLISHEDAASLFQGDVG